MFNLSQTVDSEQSTDDPANNQITSAQTDAVGNDVTGNELVKLDSTEQVLDGKGADTNGAQTDAQTQTIVLDGPLSHIYTKALNLAYANEGTSSMVSLLESGHKSLDDPEEEGADSVTADGTYVYCVDSDDLSNQGLVLSSECLRIATKKYKNVILALESSHVVNARTQLLGEMGEALGVKVCYSRNNAVQSLLSGSRKAS